MNIGLQTRAFDNLSAVEAIDKCKSLGFSSLEFSRKHIDLMAPLDQWTAVLSHCAQLGLAVRSSDPVAVENVAETRRFFERARELGLQVLNVIASPDALGLLEGLALEYDLPVGLCNTGPETAWSDILSFENQIRHRDRHLGLCVDCGLFLRVPEMPERIIDRFRDRVHSIYLRDFEADEEGDVGEEMPLAEGTLDLDVVMSAIVDAGFAGPLILRYEGTQVPAEEAIHRALATLRSSSMRLWTI